MPIAKPIFKYVLPVIAPTYLVTDLVRNNDRTRDNPTLRRKAYIRLNNIYLALALFFSALLLFGTGWSRRFPTAAGTAVLLMFYFAFSRALEILLAFLIDGSEKMRDKPRAEKGLSYYDRFHLALKNYLELVLDYGILAFSLDSQVVRGVLGESLYHPGFDSILEAIYFSANTIAVLGYGEIYPTHALTQMLASLQVLTGIFLLIITFTIYVTLNFTDPDKLNTLKKGRRSRRGRLLTLFQCCLVLLIIALGAYGLWWWHTLR